MIELKFGGVSDWAEERLTQASDEQLDAWVGKILTASTLEELFSDH